MGSQHHNKWATASVYHAMYDFNLLVSCPWAASGAAIREVAGLLKTLGDEKPVIKRTVAHGIIGVKTSVDARTVVQELRSILRDDPMAFRYTLKWMPIDLWVNSDLESMREAVLKLRDRIKPGERWRMTVEKRRYTLYHRIDIIKELAELVDEKVDLKNPDKIIRVDIIGRNAGVSVLSPQQIFSSTRLPS